VIMRTFQPPRRIRLASTKSFDKDDASDGLRPASLGRPQFWANAAMRMMAFVVPILLLLPDQALSPRVMTGP